MLLCTRLNLFVAGDTCYEVTMDKGSNPTYTISKFDLRVLNILLFVIRCRPTARLRLLTGDTRRIFVSNFKTVDESHSRSS